MLPQKNTRHYSLITFITLLLTIFTITLPITAAVPNPWTPVKINGVSTHDLGVDVWGRRYQFGDMPFPVQIKTADTQILADPIRLVGRTEAGGVVWKEHGVRVLERGDRAVTLVGWQSSDVVTVDICAVVEFDGFIKFKMTLIPKNGGAGRLKSLWLEIPLERRNATLLHYWPTVRFGGFAGSSNSQALLDGVKTLPFKANVWVGWEDGGLSWCSETDQEWRPGDLDKAIEIIADKDKTVLRLHLLDESPGTQPVSYTFGLQATPVKAWPADYLDMAAVNRDFYSDYKHNRTTALKPVLSGWMEQGINTLILDQRWAPIDNHWGVFEDDVPIVKSMVSDCHKLGVKVIPYFGYCMSTLSPEWSEASDEALFKLPAGQILPQLYRDPPQEVYISCLKSKWSDRWLKEVLGMVSKYRFDGVYLDGTIVPWPCSNEKHGCGYRTADGTLHETYPIFAVREKLMKLYEELHGQGKLINAHLSTYCGTSSLSFVDSYWDGEQFMAGELSEDPSAVLPLESFRTEFMGRNFGVPADFLVYPQPPNWTEDKALSFTLIHGVMVRSLWPEKVGAIRHALSKFGVSSAEWFPYWRNSDLINTEPAKVKASVYMHKRVSGDKPRILIIASNLSDVPLSACGLELAEKTAGHIKSATDALTGEVLSVDGNTISLPIPGWRMRMILIR